MFARAQDQRSIHNNQVPTSAWFCDCGHVRDRKLQQLLQDFDPNDPDSVDTATAEQAGTLAKTTRQEISGYDAEENAGLFSRTGNRSTFGVPDAAKSQNGNPLSDREALARVRDGLRPNFAEEKRIQAVQQAKAHGVTREADLKAIGDRAAANAQLLDSDVQMGEIKDAATARALDRVGRLFGKTIRVVRLSDNAKFFDGVVFSPNEIYIAEDSAKPIFSVVMHEILHSIRKGEADRDSFRGPSDYNSDLYDELKRVIAPKIKAGALEKYRENVGLQAFDEHYVTEEMIADFFGDQGSTPEFWADLKRELDPTTFQRIVDMVKQYVDQALEAIGATPLGSDQYISDLKSLRAAAVKASAEHIRRQEDRGLADTSVLSDPAFSRSSTTKAPTFFSQLARTVESELGNAEPPLAVAAKLNGWVKKGKVKEEEVQWTGLREWLQMRGEQGGKVTKQEVAQFLDQGGVQVEEVMYGDNTYPQSLIDEHTELNFGPGVSFDSLSGALQEQVMNDVRTDDRVDMPGQDGRGGTKYRQYTMPGGENYRELLLTLPEDSPPGVQTYVGVGRHGQILTAEFETEAEVEEAIRQYAIDHDLDPDKVSSYATVGKARVKRDREKRQNYRTSHWDEPNVLAHIRFNDRTDTKGNKVLFIEEIQSDWHQEGRKKGYGKPKLEVVEKGPNRFEIHGKHGRVELPGRTVAFADRESAQRAIDDGRAYRGSNTGLPGVPDAPFKKTWPDLALKRMIRYAADNGYDKIAWAPGDVQADRYDLSNQVDQIRYIDKGDGTYDVWASNEFGGSLSSEFDRQRQTPEQIESFVGKEIAERIVKGAGRADAGDMVLEGVDLKIGGEGMRAFYDREIPARIKKLAKKFGVEVGTTSFADSSQHEVSAQAFPITDALREQALGVGFPMFSRRQVFDVDGRKVVPQVVANELGVGGPKMFGDYVMVRSADEQKIADAVQSGQIEQQSLASFDELKTQEATGERKENRYDEGGQGRRVPSVRPGAQRPGTPVGVSSRPAETSRTERGYTPPADAVTVRGVHFSDQALSELDSARSGAGVRGAEERRLGAHPRNPEDQRTYLYEGTAGGNVTPETVVHSQKTVPHEVDIRGVYDLEADPAGLLDEVRGAPRDRDFFTDLENEIARRGYRGYVLKPGGDPNVSRFVVLVGEHKTPVAGPKDSSVPLFSRRALPKQENRVGAVVSAKPGHAVGTFQYPKSGGQIDRLAGKAEALLTSTAVARVLGDFGFHNIGLRPIRGTWEGEVEPSMFVTGKTVAGVDDYGNSFLRPMNFEETRELANLLGWVFQQDAVITTDAVDPDNLDPDAYYIPTVMFGAGRKLSDSEFEEAAG